MPSRIPFEPGQTFGRLTVLKDLGSRNGCSWSLMQCECGEIVEVRNNSLQKGVTKSCGCLKREVNSRQMKALNQDPIFQEKARKAGSATMKAKWKNPEWRTMHSRISSEVMNRLSKDPEFQRKRDRAASRCLKAMWKDPSFRAIQLGRLRAYHEDPEWREKTRKASSKNMTSLHQRGIIARTLARKPSGPEAVFYGLVYGNPITSQGFVAQIPIASGGTPDGMYPEEKIVLELDGGGHNVFRDRTKEDMMKDKARKANGWLVLREEDENILFLKTLSILDNYSKEFK